MVVRPSGCGMAAALALVVVAGCAPHWQRTAATSIQSAIQSASAARELATETSEKAQARVVEDLRVAAEAIPADAADRAIRVEALKAAARGQLAEIRAARDRVFVSCGKIYRMAGQASVLVAVGDAGSRDRAAAILADMLIAMEGLQ